MFPRFTTHRRSHLTIYLSDVHLYSLLIIGDVISALQKKEESLLGLVLKINLSALANTHILFFASLFDRDASTHLSSLVASLSLHATINGLLESKVSSYRISKFSSIVYINISP